MKKNVLTISFILILLCFMIVQIKGFTNKKEQNVADLNCEKETVIVSDFKITSRNNQTELSTPFCNDKSHNHIKESCNEETCDFN